MRSIAHGSGRSSQRSLPGARYLTVVRRYGLLSKPEVAAPLGTQRTAVDRRFVVALDVDDPPVFGVHDLGTPDRTIWTHADAGGRAANAGVRVTGRVADRVRHEADM